MRRPQITSADVVTFFTTFFLGALAFIFVLVFRYNSCDDNDLPSTTRKKCIDKAQTGDIVVVSYTSKRGKIVRVFTGSLWIHVGLIVRTRAGKVYVLEAARYSRSEHGILAKPIEEWLDFNEGNFIAWRPYKGKGIDPTSLRGLLEETSKADVNLFVVDWLKTMYKTSYVPHKTRDKYYCSEFVAHSLQELKVLSRVNDPSGYKPWELLYGDLELRRGHSYGQAKLVF